MKKILSGLFVLSIAITPLVNAENPPTVLLSEIAWMGTETSYNDEWIELYNTSSTSIDITGWYIKSTNEKLRIDLIGTIETGAFFILERTNDETLPSITADQIYTGALKNSDVGLELYNANNEMVDSVEEWYAGDNSTKATMERADYLVAGTDPNNWCTSTLPSGSPQKPNTCNAQSQQTEPEAEPSPEPTPEPEPAPVPAPTFVPPALQEPDLEEDEELITADATAELKAYKAGSIEFFSILPNPEGTDKGNEKITLKNKSGTTINLFSWSITDASGKSYVFDSWKIDPSEKLEIFQTEFKLNLNNKKETLVLKDPLQNKIDEIEWIKAASGQKIIPTKNFIAGVPGKITRVIDGDTVKAKIKDQVVSVRLIGVDTPETKHPKKGMEWYGKEATEFLVNAAEGKDVIFDFEDRKMDRYGRLLGYVYLEDNLINAEIVRKGYGYAYTRFPFRYLEIFKKYEKEAQKKRLGLWENKRNAQYIATQKEISKLEPDMRKDIKNTELFKEAPAKEEKSVPTTIRADDAEENEPDCSSDALKIDSIMPNPKKGEGMEFIRIKNTGKTKVCLVGWTLDDDIEKGSKPFDIKGGSISAGGIRTFRKSETALTLNNSNDCASLINPNGDVTDQICYKKTHKNEVFTHAGSTWKPKIKIKNIKKRRRSKKITVQEPINYFNQLASGTFSGFIESVDEEKQEIKLKVLQPEPITVSYASSGVNMDLAKNLLDLKKPVELKLRIGSDKSELVSISQESSQPKKEAKNNKILTETLLMSLALLTLVIGLLIVKLQKNPPA